MTTEELQAEKDSIQVKIYTFISGLYAEYPVSLEIIYKGNKHVDRAFYPVDYKTEANWLKVKDTVIEKFKEEVLIEHLKLENHGKI